MALPFAYSRRMATVFTRVAAVGITVGVVATYSTQRRSVLADSTTAPPKTFGSGPAFLSLPLESAELVNHNTKRLRFKLPDQDAVSGLPVTSSLLTMSWPKGRWFPVVRPYSPISGADERGHLDFLVKHYEGGKSSTHLHSLQPGDKLLFAVALKEYQWKANAFPHVLLIAGGAGITPIYQLAKGILDNPADKTAVTVVFGVNSDQDVLLKQEFDAMSKEHTGRFQAVYTVSRPVEGSSYRKGYVNGDLLNEVIAASGDDDARRDVMESSKVFVCGPPAMAKSLVGSRSEKGVLEEIGFRKDQIHKF